jgi:hypothetical protein
MSNAVSASLPLYVQSALLPPFLNAATNKTKKVAGKIFLESPGFKRRCDLQKTTFAQGDVGDEKSPEPTPPSNNDILQSAKADFELKLAQIKQNGVFCSNDANLLENILYSDKIQNFRKFLLEDLTTIAITARLLDSKPLLAECQEQLIERYKRIGNYEHITDDQYATRLLVARALLVLFSQDDTTQESLKKTLKGMPELTFFSLVSCLAKNEISLTDLVVSCDVTDDTLEQVLMLFPKLQKLDLSGCFLLTANGLTAMAQHCKTVDYLDLSGCLLGKEADIVTIVSNFKALKTVALGYRGGEWAYGLPNSIRQAFESQGIRVECGK